MANPGRYRDLITLQTEQVTVGENYAQTVVFVDAGQFWAEVKTVGGFEVLDTLVMQGQAQFRVRCEWNPIAAAIQTNQRLKLENRNGLLLNVTSTAEDMNGSRRTIEFVCERLEHDSQ